MQSMIISCFLVFVIGYCITVYIRKQYKFYHSRQLLSYIPNVWTSLGILGTFVSIVWSLSLNKNYYDVSYLIRSISPAFGTSIVGIMGAIISSMKNKIMFAKEDAKDEKGYKAETDQTPEVVLVNLLKAMNNNNVILTEQFQKIDNTMSSQNSIIEGFVNNLISKLSSYYDGVLAKTGETTQNLIEKHIVAYKNILEQFNKELSSNSQNEIILHKKTLEDIHNQIVQDVSKQFNDSHDVYVSECKKISDEFEAHFENIVKRLSDFLESINGNMSSVDSLVANHTVEIHDRIESETQSLEKICSSIKESSDGINGLMQKLNISCQNIQTATIDKLTEITSSMSAEIRNINTEYSSQLCEFKDTLVDKSKTLIEEELKTMLNAFHKNSLEVLQKVEDLRSQLANKEEERAASIYNNLNENINKSVEELAKALKYDAEQIETFLTKMQATNIGRDQVLKTLKEILQKLNSETELVTTSIQTIKDNKETAESIQTALEESNEEMKKLCHNVSLLFSTDSVEVIDGHKLCPNCQTSNSPDSRFCTFCGRHI